ncbi:MAG: heparin lyase I family protein [Halobacteriovoraceae bacterium]|nr:heparin lyase I family protein [Halobacteriovoraceae bacterium]MCB9095304.1 heparin lyase I family protein [Halobacteriovoraceae bacterium]
MKILKLFFMFLLLNSCLDSKQRQTTFNTQDNSQTSEPAGGENNPDTSDNDPGNSDTIAPIISEGLPKGELNYDISQVEMTLASDEVALCRYSDMVDSEFIDMTNMEVTNDLTHKQMLSGLMPGETYEYFIKCIDGSDNLSEELQISFSIKDAPAPLPPADYYRNFEGNYIPLTARSAAELAQSNGCFGRDYDDFFTRDLCVATNANELQDSASEKSNLHARTGSSSVRFYLKPSDPNNWPSGEPTHRTELRVLEKIGNIIPPLGTESWYGFSTYFPSDFVFVPNQNNLPELHRFIFVQFQHGGPGSPNLSLQVLGDKIVLRQKTGLADTNGVVSTDYQVGAITKGAWHDFVLRVVWENNNTGLFQLWFNNNLVVQKFNTDTSYDDVNNGSRIKFGMYYWRWKEKSIVEESFDLGIYDREIFFDDMRLYTGPNGYDRVKPRD